MARVENPVARSELQVPPFLTRAGGGRSALIGGQAGSVSAAILSQGTEARSGRGRASASGGGSEGAAAATMLIKVKVFWGETRGFRANPGISRHPQGGLGRRRGDLGQNPRILGGFRVGF